MTKNGRQAGILPGVLYRGLIGRVARQRGIEAPQKKRSFYVAKRILLCVDSGTREDRLRLAVLKQSVYHVVIASEETVKSFSTFDVDLSILVCEPPDAKTCKLTQEIKRLRPTLPLRLLSSFAATSEISKISDACIRKIDGPMAILKKISKLCQPARKKLSTAIQKASNREAHHA